MPKLIQTGGVEHSYWIALNIIRTQYETYRSNVTIYLGSGLAARDLLKNWIHGCQIECQNALCGLDDVCNKLECSVVELVNVNFAAKKITKAGVDLIPNSKVCERFDFV